MVHTVIGLDFGTTNTVVSMRRPAGTETLSFKTRRGVSNTLRTVLAFWQDPKSTALVSAVGRDALSEFTEFPEDTRLIQSLKSYAANGMFRQTMIYGKPYTYIDLMERFLRGAFDLLEGAALDNATLVVGRPVKFAGYSPEEQVALSRYREAFQRLGVADVSFVLEPVAAALTFAKQLTGGSTVLIGDFGGGTTDFSILRLKPGSAQHEVLGVGGIGVAGDQFDYRIMDHAVLPLLGKGSLYKSMGKTVELPKHAFDGMARWNELSFLRQSSHYRDLKSLASSSLRPALLERMFDIVDNSKGLSLYDAIAGVKQALSTNDTAVLQFEGLGGGDGITISREDFERWISDDLTRIAQALATTLEAAKVSEPDIDAVFLTGGTSLVPAVRRLFAARFGDDRLHGGNELISVANGLAEVA